MFQGERAGIGRLKSFCADHAQIHEYGTIFPQELCEEILEIDFVDEFLVVVTRGQHPDVGELVLQEHVDGLPMFFYDLEQVCIDLLLVGVAELIQNDPTNQKHRGQ